MSFPGLRMFGRLLRYLKPHLGSFGGSLLFMIGFAAFSGFSLAMIVPFTEIVLSGQGPEELARRHSGNLQTGVPGLDIPLPKGWSAASGGSSSLTTAAGTSGGADSTGDLGRMRALARKGMSLRAQAEARFYGLIRGRDRGSTLRRFCVAVFLVFLIKNLLWYGQSFLAVRVEQNVIRDLREGLFRHYQSLSVSYFSQTNSGTLISKMVNDIELVKGAVANGISDLLRQSLLLLVYLLTVLLASWKLFLFAIVVLPPNLWLIDRIGQTLRRSTRVSQTRMARLTAVLSETLSAIRVVKAFGLEPERERRFARESREYARTMVRLTRIGSLATPLTEILGVLVAVAILWYAGSHVAENSAGVGRFILFIIGMLSMMQPIKVLSQVNIRIQQGLGAAGRIFEVLDAAPTVQETAAPRPCEQFRREIRLEEVDFFYRSDAPVLTRISLAIGHGEVVALVGPSGAGKSTLVDLIPRFHDPTTGRVTLDGIDLREFRLRDLRALIGLVTQETMLFEGTIRENIAMGRLDASAAEIEAAAVAANAHEFITRLPEGYEAWIGERGSLLSGGQRQRLAIARAILRNPQILIFDEATSHLDLESEALVQAAIDNLLRHRTAIVIAHRLSTVRHADRIVVLEEGRIAQEGRHEELMAQGGSIAGSTRCSSATRRGQLRIRLRLWIRGTIRVPPREE